LRRRPCKGAPRPCGPFRRAPRPSGGLLDPFGGLPSP